MRLIFVEWLARGRYPPRGLRTEIFGGDMVATRAASTKTALNGAPKNMLFSKCLVWLRGSQPPLPNANRMERRIQRPLLQPVVSAGRRLQERALYGKIGE